MSRPDLSETLTLGRAYLLSLRQAPRLAPLVVLLALALWQLLWTLGLAGDARPLYAASLPHLGASLLQGLVPAMALAAGGLIGFILTAASLRQLTRSGHLEAMRLGHALEYKLWPLLRYLLHVAASRYYLLLLSLLPLALTGLTPIGGIGLLLDLGREGHDIALSNGLVGLLCLAILYYFLPYYFAAYQVLFHDTPPAEAVSVIRQALHGHRLRVFSGLLIAALPYYLADEILFYADLGPVLRHAIDAGFTLPFITASYLFYLRLEEAVTQAAPPAGYPAPH